jgi:hypothetical protein
MTAKQRLDLVSKQKKESSIDVISDLRYKDSLVNPQDFDKDMFEENKEEK